jgi:hypothetical protein
VRRTAWILTALSVFLLADGLWMELSHYHPADQNTFTGNTNLILSDGQVVLISAGLLIVATVVMWVLVFRREALARQQRAQHASRSASKA